MEATGPPTLDLSDPEIFKRVYERYARRVHAAAYRVVRNAATAEDVTQDVFIRLWRDPSRFDPRRGDLGPFLQLMARSRALDLWRTDQVVDRTTDRLRHTMVGDPATDEGPAQKAERDEEAAAVRAAVRRLPPAQREAIALAYWGDLTAAEIARRLRVPVGTAKGRLRLGLAKLRIAPQATPDGPVGQTA
jgi:RNA polymerase sigma-70 factor (ECF subfamily)